jgi:diguanylate cyclase
MSADKEDRYREKYHELLQEFETKEAGWGEFEQRIRRTLTHLILISQGPVGVEIEGYLDGIREALKRGVDLEEIEANVEKIREMVLTEEKLGETGAKPYSIHEIIIQIIERIPLSVDLSGKASKIVKRIANGVPPGEMTWVVNAIAALVLELRTKVETEKRQLEALLKEITQKLREMGEGIEGAHGTALSNFESNRSLQKVVDDEVRGIQDSAAAATDLKNFREQLASSLEAIKGHLKEKHTEDVEREKALTREVEALKSHVNSLKKEVDANANKLQEAREASWRDPLTGCFNRLAYNERLQAEYSRAKRHNQAISLAVFDIDKFKNINDNFGHPAGDQVLKAVAHIANSNMRDSDVFCRHGGEEFVAILPETDAEGAMAVAEKVRIAVSQFNFHSKGDKVVITLSAGVAKLAEGEEMAQTFSRADKALYEAKNSGRNRCVNGG